MSENAEYTGDGEPVIRLGEGRVECRVVGDASTARDGLISWKEAIAIVVLHDIVALLIGACFRNLGLALALCAWSALCVTVVVWYVRTSVQSDEMYAVGGRGQE